MDRFRIKALEKIIETGELGDDDRCEAIKMLRKKSEIYRQGALKRDKQREALRYQQLIDRYSA